MASVTKLPRCDWLKILIEKNTKIYFSQSQPGSFVPEANKKIFGRMFCLHLDQPDLYM